ncbi:hypothetical protein EV177_005962 [Coemansia sp. RSA 1804]|nr:hypothetical protein EV177_005962 [Coemansia sp. RSA 1804]
MDVTRLNFAEALREFREAVAECDFAAMDMEMTGLYESKEQQPHRLDSADERYAKLKRSVETYGVMQVGISLFTWREDGDGGFYEARPFNFNVFPATTVGRTPVETHMGFKNTALEFLARNSFDFNKWVYSGIPFLRAEDANRIRAERAALLGGRQAMVVADDGATRTFVKGIERALRAFAASGERTLRCETANAYQRKIVHDMAARHDTLATRGIDGDVEVFRVTRKEMAKLAAKRLRLLDASIDEARGFCAVVDLLSAARKPVVGHNMPLDVLHAYAKFHRALPSTRIAFEQAVAGFLPVLIDTKYIIESTPAIKARYKTSSLEDIAPMLELEAARDPGRPLVRFHPRFAHTAAHKVMHEAGYDAYITGATFIRLLKLDGGIDLAARATSASEHGGELVLYRYINRLYMLFGDNMAWRVGGGGGGSGRSSSGDSRSARAASPAKDKEEAPTSAMENDADSSVLHG